VVAIDARRRFGIALEVHEADAVTAASNQGVKGAERFCGNMLERRGERSIP
jgi:hypothetical protein